MFLEEYSTPQRLVVPDRKVMLDDWLEPVMTSDIKLMMAIDGLNSRFGRGTIKLSGGDLREKWSMRQERKSPDYTSDWTQVPAV